MTTLFETLAAFLDHDDWTFARIDGTTAVQLGFESGNGQWLCYAQTFEEERQLLFYSIAPLLVPDERRLAIAELLTRANFGLVLGNFELDYADGQVRFKTSIDVEGDQLSEAMVKRVIYSNVVSMDRYLPGIQAVIGGESPVAALARSEG